MVRTRRRHSTGFGYIGFGNNHSTFNRHSKKPFSVVKERLNYEAELHYKLDFTHKSLTKEEKDSIKNSIRTYEKQRLKRVLVVFLIAATILAFLIKYLIDVFVSRL